MDHIEVSRDDIKSAIAAIQESLHEAESSFLHHIYQGNEDVDLSTAAYYVEKAFTQALVFAERLGLTETYKKIDSIVSAAKKDALTASEMGEDEPHLVYPSQLRTYVDSIADAYGITEADESQLLSLKNAIRRSVYSICDTTVFPSLPANESDVHKRIESILKVHYSDLQPKPSLTKPIKNFIPDTGIPSVKTLLEYKFVTTKAEAKLAVDEILADTMGYRSSDWRKLLVVIYETHRLYGEEDWVRLMRKCGLGSEYDVVVLSGDAKQGGGGKNKNAKKK